MKADVGHGECFYDGRCKRFSVGKQEIDIWRSAGKEEVFYLTTHSTHFIYSYMASDIWLRTILIVRKENLLLPHGLLFPISSKGSFICTIPQTG